MFISQGLFPGDVAVGEVVANALAQVGVKVAITKIEAGSYWDALRQDRANLKWDLAMFGFNPANASGLYHLVSLFKSNKDDAARPDVWNVGRYRNREVDRLLDEAGTNPDRAKAADDLAQAQKLIWNDAPYIWLQINENVTATRKQVIGVQVWPSLFTDVRYAAA
jgi:ABC-type transport system substrate-binding protein